MYEKLIVSCAISNTFKNQRINYLEARVSPKNRVEDNIRFIEDCDKYALSSQFTSSSPYYDRLYCDFYNDATREYKYYYIFHFIKKPKYEIDYHL